MGDLSEKGILQLINRRTMIKLTFRLFSYLLLVCFISSCAKEYSCEDCYSPKPAPVNCQALNVQGVFQQGLALDNSNNIELTIQLDKAGFYLFSTEKINGIIFSAQGNFPSGQQTIKLYGQGVPAQPGVFKFRVNRSDSCSINIQVGSQPLNVYYYSAIIDGIAYESKALDTNGITAWGAMQSGGFNSEYAFKAVVGNRIWPPASGYTGLMILKGWLPNHQTATNAQVKDFLKPGPYPYTDPNWALNPPFVNGVAIVWYDFNGKIWYSDKSSDQTGRSFKITSCTEKIPGPNSTYELNITAEFNCKLYDDLGNEKILTNGKFYGFTGRY